MGIRAIQRVGIGVSDVADRARPDHLRQIFQIDLMADAGTRRDDAELVERFLTPAQERITLAVALEFQRDILLERVLASGDVHHDGMVDHQIDGDERIDLLRITAERDDAIAHGRQIDHGRDACEVLHQNAGGLERHFLRGMGVLRPVNDRLRVLDAVGRTIRKAQDVFEQHFQADGQARDVAQFFSRDGQGEIAIGAPSIERSRWQSRRSCPTCFMMGMFLGGLSEYYWMARRRACVTSCVVALPPRSRVRRPST